MSKVTIFIGTTTAFLLGVFSHQLYSEYKSKPSLSKQLTQASRSSTETKQKTDAVLRFTDPAAKVAFYCSRNTPCEALLNTGETTTLRLVGDVEKTWIILGDKKIPSQLFYEKYYRGTFPEAVAFINLPE